jgi:hypothetical protein
MTRRMAAILLGLALGVAWGQSWTIQTAAFQDYRQARAQVDELNDLGFDAYSEFVMQDGRQFARVRLGCFTTREAAVSFAADLRDRLTGEAVAQPLTPGATPRACVRWDPGFVKPAVWRVVRQGSDIVFRVELGGHVGYLRHDGTSWSFGHSLPAGPSSAAGEAARFRAARTAGADLVQARLADGSWAHACSGRLLWQLGGAAVVERPDSVIACVVDETVQSGGG